AVLRLSANYLRPTFALIATAICLLYVWTIFLSDLLYAEVPFARVIVVFVLVAANSARPRRLWPREAASLLLAGTGFLLRTTGIALLAAWIFEAIVRRRWKLAAMRGVLALLPILGWQAYVVRVRASDEYKKPAYEYQRAPYLYYNVSYADNVLLIDASHSELGRINARALATRLTTNVPSVVLGLGETVSAERRYWIKAFDYAQHHLLGATVISKDVVLVPILILAGLVVIGLGIFVRRGT